MWLAITGLLGTHFSASALSTFIKSQVLRGNPVANFLRKCVDVLALNVGGAKNKDHDGNAEAINTQKEIAALEYQVKMQTDRISKTQEKSLDLALERNALNNELRLLKKKYDGRLTDFGQLYEDYNTLQLKYREVKDKLEEKSKKKKVVKKRATRKKKVTKRG